MIKMQASLMSYVSKLVCLLKLTLLKVFFQIHHTPMKRTKLSQRTALKSRM